MGVIRRIKFRGVPPMTIPEPEFKARVMKLIPQIMADRRVKSKTTMTELYILHNDRIVPAETCKTCNSKVSRVYKTVKAMYDDYLKQNNNA